MEKTYNQLLKNNKNHREYYLNLVDNNGAGWEHYFEFIVSEFFIKKNYIVDTQLPWSYYGTPDFGIYHNENKNGFLISELSSINNFKNKKRFLDLDSKINSFIVGEVKTKGKKSQIDKYINTKWPSHSYEFFYSLEKNETKKDGLIYIDNQNLIKISDPKKTPHKIIDPNYFQWFQTYLKINFLANFDINTLRKISLNTINDKKLNGNNLIKLSNKLSFKEILNLLD